MYANVGGPVGPALSLLLFFVRPRRRYSYVVLSAIASKLKTLGTDCSSLEREEVLFILTQDLKSVHARQGFLVPPASTSWLFSSLVGSVGNCGKGKDMEETGDTR